MSNDAQHIPYEQLVAYALDELSQTDVAEVTAHLGVCLACTAQVAQLTALWQQLRYAEYERPTPEALRRAKGIYSASGQPWRRWLRTWQQVTASGQLRRALAVLVLTLTLASAGGRMVAEAAQTSLPGDGLYPVKQVVEQLQIATAWSDVDRAQVHLTQVQTRVQELVMLASNGQYDEIPSVVDDYRGAIDTTAEAFRAVARHDQAQGVALVHEFEQSVSEGAQTLKSLSEAGPPSAQPIVDEAVQASEAGKAVMRAQMPAEVRMVLDLTSTPDATSSPVYTLVPTIAWTPTQVPAPTKTAAPTATGTPVPSATPPATATEWLTATASPMPTTTPTTVPSETATPTSMPSATFTTTPTQTATATESATPTAVPSATSTASATPTEAPSATSTASATPTEAPSATPTASASPPPTATATASPNAMPSATASLQWGGTPPVTAAVATWSVPQATRQP